MSTIATPPIPKAKVPYAALIGRVVEHHRRVRGIHQEAIAQVLSISQSAYSRLEKGQSAMSVTQLHIVATQLGTTPAVLLQQTEHYAAQLRAQGVEITDEKPDATGAVLIGLALLAALIAAASS